MLSIADMSGRLFKAQLNAAEGLLCGQASLREFKQIICLTFSFD